MLGFRFTFNQPHQQSWWSDGSLDWFWAACEREGLPVGLLAGGHMAELGTIAGRHPNLKLHIDHHGRGGGGGVGKDDAAFADLGEMLALAKYPNVAVKLSGAPSYSSEPYPYRNIHKYIRQIFDAFGAQRCFWGTDITRMPCSYRQCVTMFTKSCHGCGATTRTWSWDTPSSTGSAGSGPHHEIPLLTPESNKYGATPEAPPPSVAGDLDRVVVRIVDVHGLNRADRACPRSLHPDWHLAFLEVRFDLGHRHPRDKADVRRHAFFAAHGHRTACGVEMDFLLAKIKCRSAFAHPLGLHPEHVLIKVHAAVDIGDGEIHMVYALDLHGRPFQCQEIGSLPRSRASGQRGITNR
jgi:Amidohydrolase